MTKEELLQILKENLRVEVFANQGSVGVTLYFDGIEITSDCD